MSTTASAGSATKIILGVLALAGVLGAALIKSHAKPDESTSPSFTNYGEGAITSNGSNNTITANNYAMPKACRLKSHGIESFAQSFDHEESSHYMGGGYDPGKWCDDVIGRL